MSEAPLKQTVIGEMQRDPRHWSAYYKDPAREPLSLQFSLSDRIRYYWSSPIVERACARLLECLAAADIPLALLSQYLPTQYAGVRAGRLRFDPRDWLLDAVEQVLSHYRRACA